jgi:hypothetical protein
MGRSYHTVLSVFAICLSLSTAGCNDEPLPIESPPPQGCQSRGVYAVEVVETDLRCLATNAYTDANEALGPPDAGKSGEGKLEFFGMLSLGVDGSVVLYMGSCIQNLAGTDLRVFQEVSQEAIEVLVSTNPEGPFYSLGIQNCRRFCDFDIEGSNFLNARYVKIIDRESITFPGAACDNTGPSPGADIDAVEVLHPGS